MPVDDPMDLSATQRQIQKDIERLKVAAGSGGDSSHAGAGDFSIALGDAAESPGSRGVAIGQASYADTGTGGGGYSTAVGAGSYADADAAAFGSNTTAAGVESVAIGDFANAQGERAVAIGKAASAPNDDDFVLGNSSHNVQVPGDLTVTGTFSNPSARRLKENITDAPALVDIFPKLYEWEYIGGDGRRRVGPIADELVGTDAERFVTFDGDGNVAGVETVAWLVAQVSRLHARVTELEERNG